MDWDDVLEARAAELQQKRGSEGLFETASSAGLLIYFAWTGALALGCRKVALQVLEAYKQGFQPVVGYELNPWLLKLSQFRAWWAGCYGKVFYHHQDLWKADLSDCSNVTVFLAPSVVPELEKKLISELPDGACVVAARFPFLRWTPSKVAGESLYKAWAYNIRDIRQAKVDNSGKSSAEAAMLASDVKSCNNDGKEEI